MHESALAKRILDIVLSQARCAGATRVRVVRGWVAETEALSAESLALQFGAHARGTEAESARLELRIVHVEARCRTCDRTFAPEHHVVVCPECGGVDGVLLGQTGVRLEGLDLEDD